LVFVGLVYGHGFGLFACAEYVAHQEQLSDYEARVSELRGYLVAFGKKVGIPEDQLSVGSTKDEILGAIKPIQSFNVGGTLTVAFLALGLAEVRSYKKRFDSHAPEKSAQLANVMNRVAHNFQRYVLVRTGIGLLTGGLVTGGALLIGLDFAFVWGGINFLLNYVPTLGSILGVVPPTLFALVQFDDPKMTLLTLGVVGGIQLLMGNFIDPLVQGKYLRLSPVVVLFVVTFWGFVWGITGALLAVPLTIFIALVLAEFPSTRFMGELLLTPEEDGEKSP
jgi:predicted PurR-regulated permease PerM